MPVTATRRTLDSRVHVETPEQVVLSYTVAGVGSRAAAAIVDALICIGAFVLLLLAAAAIMTGVRSARIAIADRWLVALGVLVQFAIMWGYYVLFEVLRDGQTPGKRLLGLRVVQESGRGLTLAGAAARNIVRVIDMQPGFSYLVGIVAAALSPRGKRVGDVVGGTIVVREHAAGTTFEAPDETTPAAATERPLAPVLGDDEFAVLDRYMARRQSITEERRAALATQLVARLKRRVPPDLVLPDATYAWLAALHDRERRARATSTVTARWSPRWRAFAALVASVRKRGGLRALPEDEVSDFVARYRELATDLARLHTAARGRELDAEFQLARLVAAGHNVLYRRADSGLQEALRFVVNDVPAEVRRSWRPIALAALLLFAPAIASYTAVVRHPELAAQLVPASLLDRAESGAARGARGGGYLPEEEAKMRGPVLASVIMSNNVQVTFIAFAAGVTAGIGTVFSLVFNGVSALGAPLGLYASKGIATQILGFVLPHGVLELSAICVAGGAGLLLATGILLPGARTRRDALVDEGLRAVRLISASTLMLIVAGLLEGNVSPLVWPLGAKLAVSLTTAVLLVGWIAAPVAIRARRAP